MTYLKYNSANSMAFATCLVLTETSFSVEYNGVRNWNAVCRSKKASNNRYLYDSLSRCLISQEVSIISSYIWYTPGTLNEYTVHGKLFLLFPLQHKILLYITDAFETRIELSCHFEYYGELWSIWWSLNFQKYVLITSRCKYGDEIFWSNTTNDAYKRLNS